MGSLRNRNIKMLLEELNECVYEEKRLLFGKSLSECIVVSDYTAARHVLVLSRKMAHIGDTLCMHIAKYLSGKEGNIVRRLVAKILAYQLAYVDEHIYGLHPSLLPDFMKDDNEDQYLLHCRDDVKNVSLNEIDDIVENMKNLAAIIGDLLEYDAQHLKTVSQ